MKKALNLLFPNQLFDPQILLNTDRELYLIEEHLFFRQYKFHKQKIAFHRASMKSYQNELEAQGQKVHYIESGALGSDLRQLESWIKKEKVTEIHAYEPCDDWLEKRLQKGCKNIELHWYPNPLFLNKKEDLYPFFRSDKKRFFQTSFYKDQRKKRHILLDDEKKPLGGQWTFDADNRKKYPAKKNPPSVFFPDKNETWLEAVQYTEKHFSTNYGQIDQTRSYPINRQESKAWLDQFLIHRFHEFGPYEDAIRRENSILNHSLLSPLMNVGLIEPQFVLDESLAYAKKEEIPINSTEGFVRQIIGWREFIRGMYQAKGSFSRTSNFWGFDRKIPSSFYTGDTGILPIDETIKKVLQTGYCHHIERLMILGNFMLLCEFDPNEVYRWFMELFIDAYDWVMVPNVYGMCLFADGGSFATKPYIGGSNYIRKMSNYPKGNWEETWDGLFWSFVIRHDDFFRSNPRTSMLVHSLKRMSKEKKEAHLEAAKKFLDPL